MDHRSCPRFRFEPQKHPSGHQFDGRVVRIVGFDPSEDAGSLPGTLGRNMCDRDVRHGVVDFEHLVPQVDYAFTGMSKKKTNLGTVPAGEKYEGTMAL